jgi:voltage-gated potassium channel
MLGALEKQVAALARSLKTALLDLIALASEAGLWKFLLADMIAWLGGSAVIYFIESAREASRIKTVAEALYFCWISMATVGYGDYTAHTAAGRAIIMVLVFIHIIIMALLSAGVASMLVARRLKEGKGLEKVRLENHLIICGWNSNGSRILQHMEHSTERVPVVLVNDLTEDDVAGIISNHTDMEIKWVAGDYTQEAVLERANARLAKGAVILADFSLHDADKSDERAILTTLTLKEMRSDLLVAAEVFKEGARPHLRRAHADEVVVAGENDAFFLLASTMTPGLSRIVRNALMPDTETDVIVREIPRHFVGKTFGELLKHVYEEKGDILLGIITHEPGMSLDQVLSDDYSVIDKFIEEKFKRAKLGGGRLSGYHPHLNPPAAFIIGERDKAVVLTRARENEKG